MLRRQGPLRRRTSVPFTATSESAMVCMPRHGSGPDMQHVDRRVSTLVTTHIASSIFHVSPWRMFTCHPQGDHSDALTVENSLTDIAGCPLKAPATKARGGKRGPHLIQHGVVRWGVHYLLLSSHVWSCMCRKPNAGRLSMSR